MLVKSMTCTKTPSKSCMSRKLADGSGNRPILPLSRTSRGDPEGNDSRKAILTKPRSSSGAAGLERHGELTQFSRLMTLTVAPAKLSTDLAIW